MAARNPESDSEDYDEEELRDELERGFDELQGANVDEDRDSEGTKPLSTGLSRSYVYLWRGAHAFREFYQNWFVTVLSKIPNCNTELFTN